MRLELALVLALLAAPLAGCLGGGEDLDATDTPEAGEESDDAGGEDGASPEDEDAGEAETDEEDEGDGDASEDGSPDNGTEAGSVESRPTAVVAHVDTGINPYHEAFRDRSPLAHIHPSAYIDGFPENATALELSLDADSYQDALAEDEDVWANVTEGELYWIPGTRIVGAISLGEGGSRADREETPILDDHGHGTMTASRAVGQGTSLAQDARFVSIEGLGGEQVRWAADQGWIDVQTNSWIDRVPPPANQLQDEAPQLGLESTSEAFAAAADEMVTIAASGNGAAYSAGVAPMPTYTMATAPDGVILVGAHDNGYLTPWSGSPPHLIADGFQPLAAVFDSLDAIDAHEYSCCTSASAPYAAGAAASQIIQARQLLDDTDVGIEDGIVAEGEADELSGGPLEDGELTREELREVLFKTAQQRPVPSVHDGDSHWAANPGEDEPDDATDPSENAYCPGCWSTPVTYDEIPGDVPTYVYTGYGAINLFSDQRATAVLVGADELPDRGDADAFYEADQTAREAYYPPTGP